MVNETYSVALRKHQLKALKTYYKACFDSYEQWADSGYRHPPPVTPPFPLICGGMECGAKTRSGQPCKNDGTSYSNGRCKFHGGASTGPVTKEGKNKSAANGFKFKRRKKPPANKPHVISDNTRDNEAHEWLIDVDIE